jgi:hypothetical protein
MVVLGEERTVDAAVFVVDMPEVVVIEPPQPIGVRAMASIKRHGRAPAAIFPPNFI